MTTDCVEAPFVVLERDDGWRVWSDGRVELPASGFSDRVSSQADMELLVSCACANSDRDFDNLPDAEE